MESKSFCYWLQGLFELTDSKTLNEKQVETIKNHLKLVLHQRQKILDQRMMSSY
jgi:hypothetical protein